MVIRLFEFLFFMDFFGGSTSSSMNAMFSRGSTRSTSSTTDMSFKGIMTASRRRATLAFLLIKHTTTDRRTDTVDGMVTERVIVMVRLSCPSSTRDIDGN